MSGKRSEFHITCSSFYVQTESEQRLKTFQYWLSCWIMKSDMTLNWFMHTFWFDTMEFVCFSLSHSLKYILWLTSWAQIILPMKMLPKHIERRIHIRKREKGREIEEKSDKNGEEISEKERECFAQMTRICRLELWIAIRPIAMTMYIGLVTIVCKQFILYTSLRLQGDAMPFEW